MSKYEYQLDPVRIDLVDDLGYEESDLDAMSVEDVYDIACVQILDNGYTVRRV